MGEEWAVKAIARGYTVIAGEKYNIVKESGGGCEGCFWEDSRQCHPKAVTICCTNGNILKQANNGLK